MSEALNMNGSSVTVQPEPPGVYREGLEVRARASVSDNKDSPATKRALGRLARLLATTKSPRADVPRGFYLNIRV